MKIRISMTQTNPEYKKYHRKNYSFFDDLLILGEEAAELIQACSKLARVNGRGYITVMSREKAIESFTEEVADVLATICVSLDSLHIGLGINERDFWKRVSEIATEKEKRFIERQQAKELKEYEKSLDYDWSDEE